MFLTQGAIQIHNSSNQFKNKILSCRGQQCDYTTWVVVKKTFLPTLNVMASHIQWAKVLRF
jgi:hypothetical protein